MPRPVSAFILPARILKLASGGDSTEIFDL
jgi:hypothetical protein